MGRPTLAQVAEELDVVASWLSGARAQKVRELAARCRGDESTGNTPATETKAADSK